MEIPIGYAQVNLKFTGAAVPTGAEMAFGIDVSGTSDTPEEIGTAIAGAWTTALLPADQVTDIRLVSVLVKFGPNLTGPSAEVPVLIIGESTDDSVPPNTSLLIRKITSDGGRAGRGRFFMPGISEEAVGGSGVIETANVEDYQEHWEDFAGLLALGDVPLVVLHTAGSPITTPSPVTSLIVEDRVATQRRRNRR